jgi:hypothetical protein
MTAAAGSTVDWYKLQIAHVKWPFAKAIGRFLH